LFFAFVLVLGTVWGGCLGAFVWILQDTKSTIQALETYRPKVNSKIFSAPPESQLLGEISSADEQRQLVSLSEIPLYLQRAVIATEDDTFYEHKGVSPKGIGSALLYTLRTGRTRGGSTITQQVVRNVHPLGVTQERTLKRKLREAVTALKVEHDFTKDEILELYLNLIFFGGRANGVQAAAHQYFGKDCWDLTLAQAATLAGLLRAPNTNDPRRNPDNARQRRNIVLQQMLDNVFITREQYDDAVGESIENALTAAEKRETLGAEGMAAWGPNRFQAPYFVEDVRRFILDQFGKNEVFGEGLEIHTTLDMRLQQAAEETLLKALQDFDDKKLDALKKAGKQNEFVPVTGALVCIDNRPGYKGFIRAMVGGRDFDKEKFNDATQARRQPGSSVKPFVWTVAIANGLTPSTMLVDEPYQRVDPWGNVWEPKNFTPEYQGPITLRNALQKSINIISVKLVERFGMPQVRTVMQRAGIRTPIENAVGLTIALGTPEVTVLDHCVAYSTFANGGVRYDPVMITEIRNRDGITLYDYRITAKKDQAIPPNVAYVMTHLMEGVCQFGTAANTQEKWAKAHPGRPRAGKTGTTNESRNAWFCGFTPDYTCVVWVGYKDNRSLGHGKEFTGGRLANPIWTDFMIAAEEGLPVRKFEQPDGVAVFAVNRETGLAGGPFEEAFLMGSAPPTEMQPLEPATAVAQTDTRLLELF
jgi:penicillin-binding protein 1A